MAEQESQEVQQELTEQPIEQHQPETKRRAPIVKWRPGSFDHPTILIFGDSGVGKTRFASTAPEPLFCDMENGMRSVRTDVDVWPISSWSDLTIVPQWLIKRSHSYKTLVIDSLNEAMKLCMDEILEEFIPGQGGVPKRNYQTLPSVNDYQKLLDDFLHFIRTVKSLPMNVVLIATTSGAKSTSDRIEPALTGKNTVQNVARYCDVIGYLKVAESDTGGTPSRVLYFDAPEALTKDRSDKLPKVLHNPSWSAMAKFWDQ